MKVYVQQQDFWHPTWLEPFAMQAIINWTFCVVVCIGVSLATPPPKPEQVTDQLTFIPRLGFASGRCGAPRKSGSAAKGKRRCIAALQRMLVDVDEFARAGESVHR